MRILAACAMVIPVLACASVHGQPGEREHARARLICETKTLTPGKTAWLALYFEIDEHWHLYWNGQNDSGFAPVLNAKFPPGFEAGEFLWPAPKRLVQPGDILDHVYEGQVCLMFPVAIPADAKPGVVEFKADPEWLVCHEVCLPGSASVTLSVRVGSAEEPAAASDDAKHFARARERIPRKLPKENPPVTMRVAEGKFLVHAMGGKEVAFYPGPDAVKFPNLIKEGQRKADRLELSFEATGEKPRIKGVIEVKPQGDGAHSIWAVDVDLESLNKSTPGPSDPNTRPRGD